MAGNRARLFLENFFVYGLTGVLGKVIPFVMLPLITRLIPDSSVFGKIELYWLMVSFGAPIAVLGMYDAMFRFFFEDDSDQYRKSICSSSLAIVIIAGVFVLFSGFLVTPLLAKFIFSDLNANLLVYVALLVTVVSALNTIIAAPTRMQNKRRVFATMHLLVPVTSYAVSIPLIIIGKPLPGLVAGSSCSIVFSLVVFWHLNRRWFAWPSVDLSKIWELLKFGIPLVPTFFIYWVFNACDRLMISHMLGQGALGVYGIGARVAGISALIYMAFSGGWQYFAFSTMKDSDHVELMSRTFEILGVLACVSTLLFLPAVRFFYPLIVGSAYQGGVSVTPFLFLSPLLLMLSQILGTQMQIIKKPGLSTVVRLGSALLNVALNFYLIPLWGIEGAAIATLASYLLMSFALAFLAFRFRLFRVTSRFLGVTLSFSMLFIVLRFFWWEDAYLMLLASVSFSFSVLWVYRRTIGQTLGIFLQEMRGRYVGKK